MFRILTNTFEKIRRCLKDVWTVYFLPQPKMFFAWTFLLLYQLEVIIRYKFFTNVSVQVVPARIVVLSVRNWSASRTHVLFQSTDVKVRPRCESSHVYNPWAGKKRSKLRQFWWLKWLIIAVTAVTCLKNVLVYSLVRLAILFSVCSCLSLLFTWTTQTKKV